MIFLKNIPNKQFILSTHSYIFLNPSIVNTIFYVKYADNQVQLTNQTKNANILYNFGYSIADYLIADGIIIVEHATDIPVLSTIFSWIDIDKRYNLNYFPLTGDIKAYLDMSIFKNREHVYAISFSNKEDEVAAYSGQKSEPNLAVVEVEDERITNLSEMYNPKKTIYATVDFIDFVGLSAGAAKDGFFSGEAMGLIKTVNALAVVVRNFNDDIVDETLGKPDPVTDIDTINDELILSDLLIAENRLAKIQDDYKRGKKAPALQAEEKLLNKISEALNENKVLRDVEFTADEKKAIGGFQFLTLKPMLVIINSDEESYNQNKEMVDDLSKRYNVLEFAGKFHLLDKCCQLLLLCQWPYLPSEKNSGLF